MGRTREKTFKYAVNFALATSRTGWFGVQDGAGPVAGMSDLRFMNLASFWVCKPTEIEPALALRSPPARVTTIGLRLGESGGRPGGPLGLLAPTMPERTVP